MEKKNNTISVDDLMQLPEIDGLVQEVKGQQTVKTERKEIGIDNDQFRLFLQHLDSYGYLVKKASRKGYWIDDDIAETLKSCDIDHKSVADILNAIVRTFIEQNAEHLREYIKKRNSLI
jgi:hypothetical protein